MPRTKSLALVLLIFVVLCPHPDSLSECHAAPGVPLTSTTERPVSKTLGEHVTIESGQGSKVEFSAEHVAQNGAWYAHIQYGPLDWSPGARIQTKISYHVSPDLMRTVFAVDTKVKSLAILITAERDFDSRGLQRIPNAEKVSTLLTPTGLPIEGGGSSVLSKYAGHVYRTPLDIMLEIPVGSLGPSDKGQGWRSGAISASIDLPADLPPGFYRLRYDFGARLGQKYVNLNGDGIGYRPREPKHVSAVFSPPIKASGRDSNGVMVDPDVVGRHAYWVLLADYNSNGYRGVIANEDEKLVGISGRNIIQDQVILPRFDQKGKPLSYSLEPQFLMDTINPQRNVPYRYDRGEWTVKITSPDGSVRNLGTARFVARKGSGATTKNRSFSNWQPPLYGKYVVEARGFIEDVWGNRYEGGGTYSFWIAKRMTMATATFQGQPYEVGGRYGRDIGFAPAVPADVVIKADLYVGSDPNNIRTVTSSGKATPGGVFGSAQGMKALPLDAPGEYHGKITATYWDKDGHLWVCAMRHAGVVYPADSAIVAHGKKLKVGGSLVDRGETGFEGFVPAQGDLRFLDHINFPYHANDAILIASEHQGANKIEPVLTYEVKGKNEQYNPKWQPIGKTNIEIRTTNGLSPHMFPEFIKDMEYFYAAAPRPGFMSRFIVGENNTRAPYWPTSRTNFGGQIGASNNGDMPGDIYRLLGGVVLRPVGQRPVYGGYMASAFILPKGSNNNRVIAAGSEDLPSPDGHNSRFYLVSVRPGMVYGTGASFTPVLQIDPVVACDVRFSLTSPDGEVFSTEGKGDESGYFVGKERWLLDRAGLWVYNVDATWQGHKGRVPGLPAAGGHIYVLDSPSMTHAGHVLLMKPEETFSPLEGFTINGTSSGKVVYYAAVTPGAVLDQGALEVTDGRFSYKFDPIKLSEKIRTYDIINNNNGKPEIGRVVHLTFFSEEVSASGRYHSFSRVILRGNTALLVRQ